MESYKENSKVLSLWAATTSRLQNSPTNITTLQQSLIVQAKQNNEC